MINSTNGDAVFQNNGSQILTISGSTSNTAVDIKAPVSIVTANIFNGVTTANFANSATTLTIANTTLSSQTINLGTASTGSSTYNLGTGATATSFTKTINLGTGATAAGSTTNVNIGGGIGGITIITGSFQSKGTVVLGNTSADTISFSGSVNTSVLPSADMSYDLGSPVRRWRNMYTGDLHLRNDRGDWTIIEERDFLSITNNHTGIRYKFKLEEI